MNKKHTKNKKTPKSDFTALEQKEKVYLLKEIEYLRSTIKEQEEIIKQLTGHTLEYEYIHPLDVCEMVEESYPADVLLFKKVEISQQLDPNILEIDGQKYKQSALIPPRTTKYA